MGTMIDNHDRLAALNALVSGVDAFITRTTTDRSRPAAGILEMMQMQLQRLQGETRVVPSVIYTATMDLWAAELMRRISIVRGWPETWDGFKSAQALVLAEVSAKTHTEADLRAIEPNIKASIRYWVSVPPASGKDVLWWHRHHNTLQLCLWWTQRLIEAYERGW